MATLICYKKCSTCRKAEKYLEGRGIEFKWRDIDKEIPSYEELVDWIERSGLEIKRFFNTSGRVYREEKLKDRLASMDDQEKIKLLSSNGMLIKRPIYLGDDGLVLLGFKEDQWDEKIK